MSDNYDPSITAEIRKRRCAWHETDYNDTSILMSDSVRQLELANSEIEALSANLKAKEFEIQKYQDELKTAWEIVAIHSFPASEDEIEINREEEDE